MQSLLVHIGSCFFGVWIIYGIILSMKQEKKVTCFASKYGNDSHSKMCDV